MLTCSQSSTAERLKRGVFDTKTLVRNFMAKLVCRYSFPVKEFIVRWIKKKVIEINLNKNMSLHSMPFENFLEVTQKKSDFCRR